MVHRRLLAARILVAVALLAAAAAGAEAPDPPPFAEAAVDAAQDPWLKEQGPPVPEARVTPVDRVWARWSEGGSLRARAEALYRTRLEYGLGDLPAPAALVAAAASGEEPQVMTGLARDLAPGLAAFQFGHARALWQSGDVGASMGDAGRAVWAMLTNLRIQLWLIENLAFSMLVALLLASLGFILLAALRVASHAAHDLGDLSSGETPNFARVATLAALVLSPLALGEGVLGVALALFAVAFVYGGPRQRNALAMAAIVLVVALHPLAQLQSVATLLIDRDPVAGSVLHVLAAVESDADVERLEAVADRDLAAAHALVLRDRRLGLTASAEARLEDILERNPSDLVALTNLGNIAMRRGDDAAAIDAYERAAAQADEPTLLFDLSQAYARDFRMDAYEATLVRAQRIDPATVAALSSFDDATLVADIGYPTRLLTGRLLSLALAGDSDRGPVAILAPGRLAESWFVTAGALALVVLFALLFAHRWDHASLCTRCGHRICTRCEETVWSEELCEDCHHLFRHPEATDPSLRMARLQALSEREARLDRVWLALSLVVPGMAGFAARRPDLAMIGLLLFGWTLTWLLWPAGAFADPLLMGPMAGWVFAIPGALAAAGYLIVVVLGLVGRRAG